MYTKRIQVTRHTRCGFEKQTVRLKKSGAYWLAETSEVFGEEDGWQPIATSGADQADVVEKVRRKFDHEH